MSEREPKPIRVRYKGPEPVMHPGVVPKGYAYPFAAGSVLEVRAVALDGNGRPLPEYLHEKAVSFDPGDIEFFRRKAKGNPETWEVVGEESIPEKIVAAVTGKRKKSEDPKESE